MRRYHTVPIISVTFATYCLYKKEYNFMKKGSRLVNHIRPSVVSYPVLVVQMVNVVYQPDYHLAVEVFATVEELPFHMLETCKSEKPFHRALVCPVAVFLSVLAFDHKITKTL